MKIASFFITLLLLVGALSEDGVAAFFELNAPEPQANDCKQFGSAYTGKSGKSMSMSKSSKGLGTSKSSKANLVDGFGTLSFFYEVSGERYRGNIDNVHHTHCVGEIYQWIMGQSLEGLLNNSFRFVLDDGSNIVVQKYQSFGDYLDRTRTIDVGGGWAMNLEISIFELSEGSEQIQDEPVRS